MASSNAKTTRSARTLVGEWFELSGEFPRQSPELREAVAVAWVACSRRYPADPLKAFRLAAAVFRADEVSKYGLITLCRQMGRWLDKVPSDALPSPYALALAELTHATAKGDERAIAAAQANVAQAVEEMDP